MEVTDSDLVQQNVQRITVHPTKLAIDLRGAESNTDNDQSQTLGETLTIPFASNHKLQKGVTHAPANHGTIDPETRDTLLHAIARARGWMDSLIEGRVASFDDIAAAENLAERHVRFLTPLAFLSPRIVTAIADGAAPGGLTVSGLARALPHKWVDQERLLGVA